MRVVAIVQARMGSTRYPGKVLKPMAGRAPLARILDNLASSSTLERSVVATSNNEPDDAIEDFCRQRNICVYRGSEHNVLERMLVAATAEEADIVVRLTGDNPCVTGDLVDLAVSAFLSAEPAADYVHTVDDCGWPYGMAVEVVRRKHMETALTEGSADEYEHVTLFVRRRPDVYRQIKVVSPKKLDKVSLTVDTPEEFEFVERICCQLDQRSTPTTVADVFATLEELTEPAQ